MPKQSKGSALCRKNIGDVPRTKKEVIAMRLLISVGFSEEITDKLMTIMDSLKKCSRKGMFLAKNDLRMNFVLMNDVDDIRPLQKAVDEFSLSPFTIHFNKLDKSRREGGDIYWAVADAHPDLDKIYSSFCAVADDYGYELENMKFKYRVCLGEHIIARPSFEVEPFDAVVDNITVVKYTQVKNKVIYKELYKKELS